MQNPFPMSYRSIQYHASNISTTLLSSKKTQTSDGINTCNPNFAATKLYPVSHFHRCRASIAQCCGSNVERRRRLNASSVELPLLPFNVDEILVPSGSKTLHLYEARYLALLEESLLRKKNLFVHFVLDPVAISAADASFAAKYGCMVLIDNVERLDVGALVSIRGISRVKIVKIIQADPYLVGEVEPIQDVDLSTASNVSSKVVLVKEAIRCLNSLEIKLKAPKEAQLQTRILSSLIWAETEPSLAYYEAFVPSLAERVSFAALQPVSGSTQSELLRLQQAKLRAMDLIDTIQRLDYGLNLVQENISIVAAKLAIQSVEL